MEMELSMELKQECALCGASFGETDQAELALEVSMFGAAAYAICPNCGARTDPDDPEWKKKADDFVLELERIRK